MRATRPANDISAGSTVYRHQDIDRQPTLFALHIGVDGQTEGCPRAPSDTGKLD